MKSIKKLYEKLSNFTYSDILLMNFTTLFISLMFWIVYLSHSDLKYGDSAEVIVRDIEMAMLIHFIVWIVSSAVNSIVLYLIKIKKKK